ncbi:hypothetical protein SAMN04488136_12233 [Vibrio xiamenensis]|uniref:Uncharacterized protein n=1 Tax=Vibrio xiamenensis TaxID=861298 RepID=A0A1G8DYQ0_9VIBR|nr:hypothetical protein [Vibrio xiamenensis]SDH62718.1 hypothetical protein SAMN04488136_12233 [Vibrio xiamenensis]
MKVKADPLTIGLMVGVIMWGWNKMTAEPICNVIETHNGKEILVPYHCEDVINKNVVTPSELAKVN